MSEGSFLQTSLSTLRVSDFLDLRDELPRLSVGNIRKCLLRCPNAVGHVDKRRAYYNVSSGRLSRVRSGHGA